MNYTMKSITKDTHEEAMILLGEAFKKGDIVKRFDEMYPRVMKKESQSLGELFGAFSETGEICGTIACNEFEYHVGKNTIKIASSGNIAVKSTARGQGLMKIMFDKVHSELREQNYDLCYLHGARTRYNYFGFELCGVEYKFSFEMCDLSKHFKASNKFVFVDLDENSEYLDEAIKINEMQRVYTKRRAEDLIDVFTARWRKPIGVLKNGEFFGSFAYGENGIMYLTLKDYNDFAEMVYLFMLKNDLTELPYNAPDYNKTLVGNCMDFCSGFEIGTPANFLIVNFKSVIKAFLELKAGNEELIEGSLTLASDLFGKFKITLKDKVVTVEDFEGDAEFNLKGYEIYDFLFNFTPKSYGKPSCQSNSWLPLPINAPYLA